MRSKAVNVVGIKTVVPWIEAVGNLVGGKMGAKGENDGARVGKGTVGKGTKGEKYGYTGNCGNCARTFFDENRQIIAKKLIKANNLISLIRLHLIIIIYLTPLNLNKSLTKHYFLEP